MNKNIVSVMMTTEEVTDIAHCRVDDLWFKLQVYFSV